MSNRRTSQRSAIVRVIREAHGPLRPLEILNLASPIVPSLGIATVYRQLRRLQDAGEVRAVDLGVNDVRYEPTDRGHHHHFLCRACDEVFDIHGCAEGVAKLAPPGFDLQGHEITLYGQCSDCTTSK
ncbi:MAG: transcriptional repressor [Chloroflexi bacterium]|nr:transcriptional repressor [Chloroflexota bacterium]